MAMSPDFPRLVHALQMFASLPAEEAETLRAAIREETLKTGQKMSGASIAFVHSGLMRAFYIDSAGRDRTKAFWAETTLTYSLGATNAHPGSDPTDTLEDWTVEAVEPTELFTLSLPALDH